jgi:coenzyme F420 hydrogenase subunit beta
MRLRSKTLDEAVERVVENGNCTGCGACALISPRVSMVLDEQGFMRPLLAEPVIHDSRDNERFELGAFRKVCPGRTLRARRQTGYLRHAIFGSYVAAWQAFASDPEIRHAGSSGGVLTAISIWLVESGRTKAVVGSAVSQERSSQTVPVRISSKQEALRSAGSRYAPVSNLPAMKPSSAENALVGKPCEVSAAHQYFEYKEMPEGERPILLSFFCAGTPSQHATDQLIEELGLEIQNVSSVRYRGNGWPGQFEVTSSKGEKRQLSYEESWGQHLGRQLQSRCQICPDGTGGHADVAVGDFWAADSRGFPIFEDAKGNSVLIARTVRGKELILEAEKQGVISLSPVDLDEVARVQPLQVDRKRTLAGRMVGRLAAGKTVPYYSGYGLSGLASGIPVRTARAAVGTFLRASGGGYRRRER